MKRFLACALLLAARHPAKSGETAQMRGDTSHPAAIIARAEEVSEPAAAVNTTDGLALHGYDPVAYFTTATPTPGLERYTYVWQGASYRFASADDLAAFRNDPDRYATQYGGYCAMALSLDRIADADPTQWAIVGGKLFVNNNPSAQAAWSKDRAARIVSADQHWARRRKKEACDAVCRLPESRP
jgi:YHS domain-containing protein